MSGYIFHRKDLCQIIDDIRTGKSIMVTPKRFAKGGLFAALIEKLIMAALIALIHLLYCSE